MRRQQRQPQRLALVALHQQFRRGDDIAEALRHLLAAHVDEAVVDPEARERRAGVRAAALRDLILVVGEDQSSPPPWMSKVSPRWAAIIAEHSTCLIHKSLVKQFEGDTVYFKVINDNKR